MQMQHPFAAGGSAVSPADGLITAVSPMPPSDGAVGLLPETNSEFYDAFSPIWELVDCDGDVPQSRSGHTCAIYKNRFVYVFGGFDGSRCFDDLYCLDLDFRAWRKIEPNGDLPTGRASHSAVSDELAGVMYIFGGSGSHFGYTNQRDLYEFNYESETWALLSNPSEDQPSARYGQSMVYYQEKLYVWGGTHGTNYPTDMHRFDVCTKQWEPVQAYGELPCGRYRHQAMVKDHTMYIVGGSGINRYGDVFTFDFPSSTWKKMHCTGTDLADGRYAHSAVLRGNFIYLYGGNDGVRHEDLLQLDLESRVWSRIQVASSVSPPGRDFHAAVLRQDAMVIFGGSSGIRRHNDTYEFRFVPRIPPCTLTRDMVALLEKSQMEEAWRAICDVVLIAGSVQLYCHAHILAVRCPRLMARVAAVAPKGTYWTMLMNPNPSIQDGLDDLLRDVVEDVGPIRVQLDCASAIAWNLLHFIYTDEPAYGNLAMIELYYLFLAGQIYDLPKLTSSCFRQLKVRMDVHSVIAILKLANTDGPLAQPVQELCKYFFMINYTKCSELEDCESLDPRQLCELMRLHNTRRTRAEADFSTDFQWASKSNSLQQDLRKLYNSAMFPDFEVVVEGEIIKVHKFFLAARCNYFASCLLTSGMVEARSSRLIIPSQSAMITSAFMAFLRFVYAGDDVLEVLIPQTAMYLVEAATFYGLSNNRLQHFCEACVKNSFNECHVLQIFEASCKLECEAIKVMALEFIVANFNRVATQSDYLRKLDKELLLAILEGLACKGTH
jgi:N-acetylneuraminic acid mutarotase